LAESTRQLNITPEEIESGKTMAAIAYLIFWLPFVIEDARKNKFVMFHVEQGIIALILCFFCGIGLIFVVIGIINAVGGKVTPLPLVGQFGEKFNLVK